MIELTREELEDILEAFRWIEQAAEWRQPWGWNDDLFNKIKEHLTPTKKCTQCGSLVKEDEC